MWNFLIPLQIPFVSRLLELEKENAELRRELELARNAIATMEKEYADLIASERRTVQFYQRILSAFYDRMGVVTYRDRLE